jgi:hypothetical protein
MRPFFLLLFATLTLLGCKERPEDPESMAIRRIILAQVARYPQMQPQDLYKLLHQAAMGSEHAMSDTAGVRTWMTSEFAAMGEGPADPMVDTISPEGNVVRVYLRPWVRVGRSTDSLTLAFMATARAIPQDTTRLKRYLSVAEALALEGLCRSRWVPGGISSPTAGAKGGPPPTTPIHMRMRTAPPTGWSPAR